MCKRYSVASMKLPQTQVKRYFKIVKDVLSRFQLPIDKCRGQRFDDAANVSEHVNGLRKKLIYEESRAIYVYCRAHKLNLL